MNPLSTLLLAVALLVIANSTGQAQKRNTPPQTSTAKATTAKAASTAKPSAASIVSPVLTTLSTYEKQLLEEINYARANPHEYVKALELFRRNFRGKEIHYPEGGVLVTNEGVAALDDAILFLRRQTPLPPLEVRSGMIKAAKVHVTDLVTTGRSGHRGTDGSQPGERLDRFGRWEDSYGENIVYESRTPRYDVIGMIIDDGTASRGHRENLFSDFRVIGIATGKRATGATLGVMTFAVGYKDK
ncbi:MAG TPA: CAP domain-containing protein [Pyrinomonadaceae bacterium]|nr:CAP domain-containing protein [Pyrinomonadaceae bacterium]